MNKSITDFIEEYVEGEPPETLTPKAIGAMIRKYIYMNYEPTKQDKLDMYEALLSDIAIAYTDESGDPLIHEKLITNIINWNHVRSPRLITDLDEAELIALQNETFYNLRKL